VTDAACERHSDGSTATRAFPSTPRSSVSHRGIHLALALGTFAVGTESFMIAAILPAIASSVRVGVPAAGQLVTAFTLVYALSSPILTALTASYSRRILLLGSLALRTWLRHPGAPQAPAILS